MLKVGMPLAVVQHAMTRDGLDPTIMEGDHNAPTPQSTPRKGGGTGTGTGAGGTALRNDSVYTKYFKMLKLGLPLGAVKNAMERDGLDPSVMDGDHDAPVPGAPSPSRDVRNLSGGRPRDTHRRTRLHWDTSNIQVKRNSVWALVEEDKELHQMCDALVDDQVRYLMRCQSFIGHIRSFLILTHFLMHNQEFASLFQAEIKNAGTPLVGVNGRGGGTRNVVQVIDPKRANNGGIILARLRMSYDAMAQAVERM